MVVDRHRANPEKSAGSEYSKHALASLARCVRYPSTGLVSWWLGGLVVVTRRTTTPDNHNL